MHYATTIIELERGAMPSKAVHVLADELAHLGQVVSDAGVLGRYLEGRAAVLRGGEPFNVEAVVDGLQFALHPLVVVV